MVEWRSGYSALYVVRAMETIYKLNLKLTPVFREILPTITGLGLRYWVYGGIGMAGVAGRIIREDNGDVDVYVLEKDFDPIKKTLHELCVGKNGWKDDLRPVNIHGRPKLNIYINGDEIFSMVPVYQTDKGVEFRAITKVVLPQVEALTQELRELEDYEFYSPPAIVIKTIFRSFISERPEKLKDGSKHWRDAKAVFTEEEFRASYVY